MNKNKRQYKLLKYLNKGNKFSLQELAQKFKVSEITIRRDVKQLEKLNLVYQSRGHVYANKFQYYEKEYADRKVDYLEEKKRIALAALDYIAEGDCIVLDSGTTVFELSKLLYLKENITVITNDFNNYSVLKDLPAIDLYFAGGHVKKGFDYIAGGVLNQNFYQQFEIDKAFLGIMGLDIEDGLFHSDLDIALAKKGMAEVAKEVIVLVDNSKFDIKSMYKIVDMAQVDVIITDEQFEKAAYNVPEEIVLLKV